ncbi:MAG TPA: thioredoxin domain-containing protein [Candidatus Limnocylindrales bacterium]
MLTSVGALIVGAAIIAFAGGIFGGGPRALESPPTSYSGIAVNGASLGSPTAPVVMEVFSDFQCPACKLFVVTELPSLLTDFVRPGFVRIEPRDIDILDRGSSSESLDLAAGAFCAGEQGRYWEYHDVVFWNQGRENRGDHNADFIARVATAVPLDRAAFDACYARTDIRQPVKDLTARAAAEGIKATPTLRINGELVTGVPAYADLSSYLTRLLATTSSTPISSNPPSPTLAPQAKPASTAVPAAS